MNENDIEMAFERVSLCREKDRLQEGGRDRLSLQAREPPGGSCMPFLCLAGLQTAQIKISQTECW